MGCNTRRRRRRSGDVPNAGLSTGGRHRRRRECRTNNGRGVTKTDSPQVTLIVDAANCVGSMPADWPSPLPGASPTRPTSEGSTPRVRPSTNTTAGSRSQAPASPRSPRCQSSRRSLRSSKLLVFQPRTTTSGMWESAMSDRRPWLPTLNCASWPRTPILCPVLVKRPTKP